MKEGFKILKYKQLTSTQEKLKELVKKGESSSWLVVLAKKQLAGYGKMRRYWFSGEGGLYFSVLLPPSNIDDVGTLTFLAAFTIAKIIKEKFGLEPFIKLPNDVYLDGKKVCGILTENIFLGKKLSFSIIGIGLNTNILDFPEELKPSATSLQIQLGKRVSNDLILKEILKGLERQLSIISQ